MISFRIFKWLDTLITGFAGQGGRAATAPASTLQFGDSEQEVKHKYIT